MSGAWLVVTVAVVAVVTGIGIAAVVMEVQWRMKVREIDRHGQARGGTIW